MSTVHDLPSAPKDLAMHALEYTRNTKESVQRITNGIVMPTAKTKNVVAHACGS